MVAHFVHKSKDGKLAVIGVLLNEGKDNAGIKTLWANLPPKEGTEYLPEKVSFSPSSMLPKELGFYNYEGSLTTPPLYRRRAVLHLEKTRGYFQRPSR